MILLPNLLARDREGAAEFLERELDSAEDPELRASLLQNLASTTNGAPDRRDEKIFLDALGEHSPRARRAAVEALARSQSAETRAALFGIAAADPDASTRENAIRLLAANPGTRGRVLDLMAEEPDPRIRTLGECTARLTEIEDAG